jgi:F0F1-type ATP synthase assembly protein I
MTKALNDSIFDNLAIVIIAVIVVMVLLGILLSFVSTVFKFIILCIIVGASYKLYKYYNTK